MPVYFGEMRVGVEKVMSVFVHRMKNIIMHNSTQVLAVIICLVWYGGPICSVNIIRSTKLGAINDLYLSLSQLSFKEEKTKC